MGAFLITGRSGVGKTTLSKELSAQGHNVFDGDKVKGLASWVNPQNNKAITIDLERPIDPTQQAWNWDKKVITKLLDTEEDVFLCGSADNQLDFHHLFDKVFVLVLPPDVQRQRIMARTEHNYGKHPEMQAQILTEQAEFVEQASVLGAHKIDASKTPNEIMQDILALIYAP